MRLPRGRPATGSERMMRFSGSRRRATPAVATAIAWTQSRGRRKVDRNRLVPAHAIAFGGGGKIRDDCFRGGILHRVDGRGRVPAANRTRSSRGGPVIAWSPKRSRDGGQRDGESDCARDARFPRNLGRLADAAKYPRPEQSRGGLSARRAVRLLSRRGWRGVRGWRVRAERLSAPRSRRR